MRYLFLVFILSCSSLSHNNVSEDEVNFRGGIYRDQSWDDVLIFKRLSWYHGLTLYYDALFYKVDPSSPFINWFSRSEKQFLKKCFPFVVAMLYTTDAKKISHASLSAQMGDNGFDNVVINDFSRAIDNHPAYEAWNLHSYKMIGYCRKRPNEFRQNQIIINFPSFNQAKLSI